jgi:hypothetical protein
MKEQYNNFWGISTKTEPIYCGDNLENINNDDITIIATYPLKKLSKRIEAKEFNRVNVILCDSGAFKHYMWWNDFIKNNSINLYLMPDIAPFSLIAYKPIYQYIKIHNSLILPKRTDKLLVTHSPKNRSKMNKKGSSTIIRIVNDLQKKYDFDFKLIHNLFPDEAIMEKSKSHIFIDQLIYDNKEINQSIFGGKITYNGGLGKSGIEGMLMNCCVITGGKVPETEPHFAPPPITWTSYDKFYEDLKGLIIDEEKRNKQIEEQDKWLLQYNNKEFFRKYLTE